MAVVDQGSLRDIQNCVEAALRTRIGEREGAPEFGITEPTFKRLPLNPLEILNEISSSEPRAVLLAEEFPEALMELRDRVSIRVARPEVSPHG
jgi:phage baseplate assembly protein W